tara:strand:- start:8728 stop:9117 length:390 start_codon:yes stop_codon:yes gene_type:complete
MGNINSINAIKRFNFEDMQSFYKTKNNIMINTLEENNQECLIIGTINIKDEVRILNDCLNNTNDKPIVIYGKNSNDEKVFLKYKQLTTLGFKNIYMYTGGMFEWLLLQDIYGDENFPTTTKELEILKYK